MYQSCVHCAVPQPAVPVYLWLYLKSVSRTAKVLANLLRQSPQIWKWSIAAGLVCHTCKTLLLIETLNIVGRFWSHLEIFWCSAKSSCELSLAEESMKCVKSDLLYKLYRISDNLLIQRNIYIYIYTYIYKGLRNFWAKAVYPTFSYWIHKNLTLEAFQAWASMWVSQSWTIFTNLVIESPCLSVQKEYLIFSFF